MQNHTAKNYSYKVHNAQPYLHLYNPSCHFSQISGNYHNSGDYNTFGIMVHLLLQ